jgi:hypothetical protein
MAMAVIKINIIIAITQNNIKSYSYTVLETAVGQSVTRLATGWETERSEFET